MAEVKDSFMKYIVSHMNVYEKKLTEIQKLEQSPQVTLSQQQIQLIREKKENLDQILLFTQMKQHYETFLSTQLQDIYQSISKTLLLGPIALFKPVMLSSRSAVQRLRQVYQLILGLDVVSETEKFAVEYVEQHTKNIMDVFQSQDLQVDLDKLYKRVQNIKKDEWNSLLTQVVDLPTIQEINQTNVDFDIQHSASSENNFQEEGSPRTEKLRQFNYDGDEERTPQQSEQEDDGKATIPRRKPVDLEDKEEQHDSAGYEASNSDRSKKQGKNIRVTRNKKKLLGQDFDTDGERVRNKKQ